MAKGRFEVGPPIGAVGAVILLASLFLDWYEPGISAFEAFEVLDLVLAGLALSCLAGLAPALGIPAPGGEGLARAVPVLAGAALVIVASQVLNHPPSAVGRGAESGQWLGLGGSAILTAGALFSVSRFSIGLDLVRPARPVRRPAAASAPGRPRAPAVRQSPPAEARAAEPEVMGELYPEGARSGPIGANDPEIVTRERSA